MNTAWLGLFAFACSVSTYAQTTGVTPAADAPPAIENPAAAAVVREFHTTAGPLQLTVTGATATGKYRISIVPQPEEGTFAGILSDGLLDAVWTEPGKSGRLLLAFTADFSRFHAIYNAANKPEHRFGEWLGVHEKNLETAPASAPIGSDSVPAVSSEPTNGACEGNCRSSRINSPLRTHAPTDVLGTCTKERSIHEHV